MRSGKKLSWLTLPSLLCVFSILLAACGGGSTASSTTKAPQSQQVLRWGFNLPDITSFDPGIATDNVTIQAINAVFTGLVQLDDNLNIKPQLAKSYDVSSDGLTYTFHLRDGLKFSDGTALTSQDVVYSIDRSLSPAVNDKNGTALTYIGSIKDSTARTTGKVKSLIGDSLLTPDANTVVIKLSTATPYFLDGLTYPTSYVVEKSVIDKWGSTNWIEHLSDNGGQGGDGPFKVLSYSHTTGIKLVPNASYYGSKPTLKELDYLPFKDTQTAYNAYLANQIDLAWPLPLPQVPAAKKTAEFSSTPALTIFYIALNAHVKLLSNQDIRTGLALALNRDEIVKSVYQGAYDPTCHIVPKGQYGYDADLKCPGGATTTGDKTLAVQYFEKGLKELGATRADFSKITFTYAADNQNSANEVAEETSMWKSVLGISVATSTISQSNLWSEMSSNGGKDTLQIWLGGWGADYPDPQDWISLQFGAGQPNNAVNYGNNSGSTVAQQKADQALMDKADHMPSATDAERAARAKVYNQIEQDLVNFSAWIPTYQRADLRVTKSYVKGLKFTSASEVPPDDWAKVYITTH